MSHKLPRNNCRACGKEVSKHEKVYCNLECMSEHLYQVYISKWLAGLVSGHGIGGVSRYVRRYLISTRGEKCEQCGWGERHSQTKKVPIEIHHIDGNWQNGDITNLQVLCPNCHALTPTFRGLNRGGGREIRRAGTAATARVL